MAEPFRFIILDPKRAKRRVVQTTLAGLGPCDWRKVPPFGLRLTPAAWDAARAAQAMSKARGWGRVRTGATVRLLAHQYAGTLAAFKANPDAVAVCWNGLNGARRVFMQAAKDAGARTLFYELAPFKGRITADPAGVNFANSLARTAAPYLDWAQTERDPTRSWRSLAQTITQRPTDQARSGASDLPPLTDPFVFVALQTPGDSQLRLFGGAFGTVEGYARACLDAAQHLPPGWHMRIKEHPTAPTDLRALAAEHGQGRAVLDNDTDTFAQVAASRAVLTVNSSVGLEAMLFEKPVVASGQVFWAIETIADTAPDAQALAQVCRAADQLSFDPEARDAFLDFLDQVYYPHADGSDSALIAARLRDQTVMTCGGS